MITDMERYRVSFLFASGLDNIATMRRALTMLDVLFEVDELQDQDVAVNGCSVTFEFIVPAEDILHAMIRGLMELHNAQLKTSWATSLPTVITSSAKLLTEQGQP